MTKGEIYPNAPLRLVSLEISFPLTSRILTRSLWDALEDVLAADLPRVEVLTAEPESAVPRDSAQPVLRRTSADNRRAVTLYTNSVTIEFADYRHYDELRALTDATLRAMGDPPPFMRSTRMGLRYINEVQAAVALGPDGKWHEANEWRPYINSALLTSIEVGPESLCSFAHRSQAYFHSVGGTEQVSLDYGLHPEGIVDPDDVLTLGEPSGPCFVLDIDAYNYLPAEVEPPADKDLLDALDRLHEVVEAVFEWSITDSGREMFRDANSGKSN